MSAFRINLPPVSCREISNNLQVRRRSDAANTVSATHETGQGFGYIQCYSRDRARFLTQSVLLTRQGKDSDTFSATHEKREGFGDIQRYSRDNARIRTQSVLLTRRCKDSDTVSATHETRQGFGFFLCNLLSEDVKVFRIDLGLLVVY